MEKSGCGEMHVTGSVQTFETKQKKRTGHVLGLNKKEKKSIYIGQN
jgi:hypothetical protein